MIFLNFMLRKLIKRIRFFVFMTMYMTTTNTLYFYNDNNFLREI